MNISEHLQKDYWVRRVAPDSVILYHPVGNNVGYRSPKTGSLGVGYVNLTQDQFLNELNPAAHEINSKFISQRPIYKAVEDESKPGKTKYVIDGYDDVETVALAIQEMIVSKKIAHLTGDDFWVASEDKDEEGFQKVESWMDYAGFWDAWVEAVSYTEREGDAALYWWYDGTGLNYEVFAYEKGDVLYPGVDDNGKPTLYRAYTLNGKPAVDVFTTKVKETWIKVDTEEEAGKTLLERLKKITKSALFGEGDVSEDGYRLLSRKDAQIGDDILQIIYFRVPDIATGPVQDCIVKFERAHSYIAEEVKNTAFPILFLKSEKITTLPPTRMNGKTIGVKGSSDSLAHSDAKFLAPPDSSDTAKINLETLWNNILRGSLSALVEPVDIRQGADSSTTIKIMFAPDIQWCKNRWKFYAKPVRHLVEVFKRLVGKVEGDVPRYGDLRISCGQNIWIPQNESERVKLELDQYYASVKSRKATMADIGNTHLGDAEQIMREKEAEKALDAKYKTTTVEHNPNVPDVTNQAPNQPAGK